MIQYEDVENLPSVSTLHPGDEVPVALYRDDHSFKLAKITIANLVATLPNTQQATITDAEVAHDLNSTFSDAEVETALNALGGKINSILDALIAFGIIAA